VLQVGTDVADDVGLLVGHARQAIGHLTEVVDRAAEIHDRL